MDWIRSLKAVVKRVETASITWYRRLNLCSISIIFGTEVLQVQKFMEPQSV